LEDEKNAIASLYGVIGKHLRAAREAAGLTQEELAFKTGLSRNYISLLELDQKSPTLQVLLRVCEKLDVSASKMIAKVEGQPTKSRSG
jgi:transcriptional regulator with XRE-family HTH domain